MTHGWSGATWFGTKSRISRMPRSASLLSGLPPKPSWSAKLLVHDIATHAVGQIRRCPPAGSPDRARRELSTEVLRSPFAIRQCRQGSAPTRP